MGDLNGDEFDTMFELILTIMFMAAGVFAISLMFRNLSDRVGVMERPDKITITGYTHYEEDPFYFTGYQAYMFAWHMDELSSQPLSWVGGTLDVNYNSNQYIDDDNIKHVTICTIDSVTGKPINQFYTWRNQMITGAGNGTERSVQKTLASIVSSTDIKSLYQGTVPANTGQNIMFHLELTDKYTRNNNLGNDPNTGGKKFSWVLAPCSH